MKTNINKSKLMSMAHSIFSNNQVENWSEALKAAWKAMKLRARMAVDTVKFVYRKVDGTIREAVGTVKDLASHFTGTGTHKSCGYTVVYFDIEKNAIRSFKAVCLI